MDKNKIHVHVDFFTEGEETVKMEMCENEVKEFIKNVFDGIENKKPVVINKQLRSLKDFKAIRTYKIAGATLLDLVDIKQYM